ncbi:transposase [Agaribacterium sp. ZY112]|uniref:transposase n=1 Tax=Agaribacterium sp. ZY112 TaxID=3233574 RepID=UPI003524634F
MTKAREQQICLDATPYYHCVSRCVRRAFLCGKDQLTGCDYEHRRLWVEERILMLAKVFAIDVCAYAVMSNHYHVVVRVDRDQALNWSDKDVVERWHRLYKGNLLSQRFIRDELLDKAEAKVLSDIIANWRERLYSISLFMQLINEGIAREANAEDQCTGRFWEGRYKSQALLDDVALAACLAYVDLNPVRVKMAQTPEASEHTSIRRRIKKAKKSRAPNQRRQQTSDLLPFVGNPRLNIPKGLPWRLSDYSELLDWTGRQLRPKKRGLIAEGLPPILERLNIDAKRWLCIATEFESRFKGLVGRSRSVKSLVADFSQKQVSCVCNCKALLGE